MARPPSAEAASESSVLQTEWVWEMARAPRAHDGEMDARLRGRLARAVRGQALGVDRDHLVAGHRALVRAAGGDDEPQRLRLHDRAEVAARSQRPAALVGAPHDAGQAVGKVARRRFGHLGLDPFSEPARETSIRWAMGQPTAERGGVAQRRRPARGVSGGAANTHRGSGVSAPTDLILQPPVPNIQRFNTTNTSPAAPETPPCLPATLSPCRPGSGRSRWPRGSRSSPRSRRRGSCRTRIRRAAAST